jgi:hypothetical protein
MRKHGIISMAAWWPGLQEKDSDWRTLGSSFYDPTKSRRYMPRRTADAFALHEANFIASFNPT